MKKRFLAWFMLLVMVFSVTWSGDLAYAQDDAEKTSIQQTEEVITDANGKDIGKKLVFTIPSGATGVQHLDLNGLVYASRNGGALLPGDSKLFKIEIRNESAIPYQVKKDGFTITTADVSKYSPLTEVKAFDGQALPMSYLSGMVTNKPMQKLFETGQSGLSLEQFLNLYGQLEEKGYASLSAYFVDYYNDKKGTAYDDFVEMIESDPVIYEDVQKGNGNGFTISREAFNQYNDIFPDMMQWAYIVDEKDDELCIQFKWPEADLQVAGYNGFYQSMFSFAFGEKMGQLDPNKNHVVCHDFGIGDYMTNDALLEEAQTYFSSQRCEPGGILNFDGKWGLDGPCIKNAYFNYEFDYNMSLELVPKGHKVSYVIEGDMPSGAVLPNDGYYAEGEAIAIAASPTAENWEFLGWQMPDGVAESDGYFTMPDKAVTIVGRWKSTVVDEEVAIGLKPTSITVYMGGHGYSGTVDDENGGIVTDDTNGFPQPGFELSLPETLKGIDIQKLYLQYQDEQETLMWKFVKYASGVHDIYRIIPVDEASARAVRMNFIKTMPDGSKKTVSKDTFTFESYLNQTLAVEVYGQGIDRDNISFVYKAGEGKDDQKYAVESGTGQLTVRGTSQNEEYGYLQDDIDVQVDKNEPGLTAKAATTYSINGGNVQVDNQKDIALLFDNMIEDQDSTDGKATLLENKADEVLGSSSESRAYDVKYLDLVDTANGNAWVQASGDVTVYWPLPKGTNEKTDFTLLHFKDLHREMETASIEDNIEQCRVENVELLDVTDTHVIFNIDAGGFSPFALVWDEENGGEVIDPPVYPPNLNTKDHDAYIVGYPDGTVQPQGDITRAEVATIFYRLLKDDVREKYLTTTNDFFDVSKNEWFITPVSTLANMGIIGGYGDGTFKPNAPITRAEFTRIAVGFFEKKALNYENGAFVDVNGNEWFADDIATAVDMGLLGGYPDGTIRPNNAITRAETSAIVNRTLDRAPDKDHLLPLDKMIVWIDNSDREAWYYAELQEATNSHDYQFMTTSDGKRIEQWSKQLPAPVWP